MKMDGYKVDKALSKQEENVTAHSFPSHIGACSMDIDTVAMKTKMEAMHGLNFIMFFVPRLIWLLSLLSAQSANDRGQQWNPLGTFCRVPAKHLPTDWLFGTPLITERAIVWNTCPQRYNIFFLPMVFLQAPPFINLEKAISIARVSHTASPKNMLYSEGITAVGS